MNRAEFLHLLEEVDARLQAKGVPVHARPLHAFMEIAGDYDGPVIGAGVDPDAYPEYTGPDLLRKIEDWYTTHDRERNKLALFAKPAAQTTTPDANTPKQRLLRLLRPEVLYPLGLKERLQQGTELLTASCTDGLYVIDGTDRYVYHYTKNARALDILRGDLLRMSPFTATNDPQENKDWVFSVGTNRPDGFADTSIDETGEIMRKTATVKTKSRSKVMCFTEDDSRAVPGGYGNSTIYARGFCHPRMWAQYADGYQGVCLIFDRDELQLAIKKSLIDPSAPLFHGSVRYRNKDQFAPAVNDPFALDFDSIRARGLDLTIRDHVNRYWRELFFEKAEDWAHEKEFRWLAWEDTNEPHFVRFERSLKAIIVGHAFADPRLGDVLMEYRQQHDICVQRLHWQNGVPFLWAFVAAKEQD